MADLATTGTGPLWTLEGVSPRLHPSVFVAPNAAIIGEVEIGEGSGIWFGCVLRGDTNFIRVGRRTNIQDGSVLHVARHTMPCILGDEVTVGHGAVVHACTVKNGGFVGMRATVMDGAVIEEGGMLAGGSLLAPGKRIGRNELWIGSPAKFVRVMTDEELEYNRLGMEHYVELAARYRAGLRAG